LDGIAVIVGRGESLPSFDVHCPLGSLPLALKTLPATVPADIPYLRPPVEKIAKWRQRLEALPSPRIALAWSGHALHVNDRNRSLPLAALEPLLSLPGPTFISVQRELRPADAEVLARNAQVVHLGDPLESFADTAAVLSLCDLLISVDTSVVHVAGALGLPAIVLLPFQPDWRWTLDSDVSPWYPALRLFRQPRVGDWTSVIERVRAELERP
jgi:hypothetical protein